MNFVIFKEEDARIVDEEMWREADPVNDEYNRKLAALTEENADKVVLPLGRPSAVLRAAGVADKPMKLYGNKVMKKMRKHGFALTELRDLPRAVAAPIAVFDNYRQDGRRSILTELHTDKGNFLVTIGIGKGQMDADFNIVSSVFGKGEDNIIDWIKRGFGTYYDKEKALDYLHHAALLAVTSDSPRLISAAKVIKDFQNPTISDQENADDDELFRDGDAEDYQKALAKDIYEKKVKSGAYQAREALQDSMAGLKAAMDAVVKATYGKQAHIEDVPGYMNPYLAENRLSSVNLAEGEAYKRTILRPLTEEVARLAPDADSRAALTDYMMAVHGLERNRIMRQREKDKVEAELKALEPDMPAEGEPDYKAKLLKYRDELGRLEEEKEKRFARLDTRDFAGLTTLTGLQDMAEAEEEARAMARQYEAAHDTDELWKRTNAATKATLSKVHECGMMTDEAYETVRDMYQYYIPLRGFDETTTADEYAYIGQSGASVNSPIKTARGRKSKADDPLANISQMAETAIVQGNRNRMVKQALLRFAERMPSDLFSVSDLWIEYDAKDGQWYAAFPDIADTDTPEDAAEKQKAFDTRMAALAAEQPDLYKRAKDAVDIPYRVVTKGEKAQHQVVVKRGGHDIVLTVCGNPRAAQAVNGLTNPDNDMSGAFGKVLEWGTRVNRQLSAFYTTRNPDFVASNFLRDLIYANGMVHIKEGEGYAWRYHWNYMRTNPLKMLRLLTKYQSGKLDTDDEIERMFDHFMRNGGETGFTSLRDIETHKRDIDKEIRKAAGRLPLTTAWQWLTEKLDRLNRAVENCARFACFVTSRQSGRSIDRAIWDAKELTVNFNKKGAGAKFLDSTGQTDMGNAAALASGLGRPAFVFWNASIQGMANAGRQFGRHPAKATAALLTLGAMAAAMAAGGDGDDGDDEEGNGYFDLPEYLRRSNLLFRAGSHWISIPLPIEARAAYGMGELMMSLLAGRERKTDGELAEAIAGQLSQLLPIDFMEGGGGAASLIPSQVKPVAEAYLLNKSWTGLPIYKDTPWNKDMPEWTKAYKNANRQLVGLAQAVNEATGGDKYTKGTIDINPAKLEYALGGLLGGLWTTGDKAVKTAEMLFGAREADPRGMPIINRVVKQGNERTRWRAVNKEYYDLKNETERLTLRMKSYEKEVEGGVFDYADKLNQLYYSDDYQKAIVFDGYKKMIDQVDKELDDLPDGPERDDITRQQNILKREAIQAIRDIERQK